MTVTDKISFLEKQKELIENKESKFLFYSPNTNGQPTSTINEIYRHAKVLEENGFNVAIIHDYTNEEGGDLTGQGVEPYWIDKELRGMNHVNIRDEKEIGVLKINFSDFLIIPEAATFLMEESKKKKLPCEKIVLLQSIDVALHSLMAGLEYKEWDILNIITSSEKSKQYLERTFSKNTYQYEVINPSIPDFFKVSGKPKKLTIGVYSKNYNDLNNKIIKPFYLRYPHLNFVHFKPLANLEREEFAEELEKCAVSVWIDRVSGFGTFPLESMASGTIPVCLVPDIQPEYIHSGEKDYNGIWATNVNDMVDAIAKAMELFIQRSVPNELYMNMQNTAQKYSRDKMDSKVVPVYDNFIKKRIAVVEKAIEEQKKIVEMEKVEEEKQPEMTVTKS